MKVHSSLCTHVYVQLKCKISCINFIHQHHKPAPRSGAIRNHGCGNALPSVSWYQRRQSRHVLESGETQPRICASLIMRSCRSHAGLLISSPPSPPLALLCFSEILIKRKDGDDECKIVPPDDGRRTVSEFPANSGGSPFLLKYRNQYALWLQHPEGSEQTDGPVYRSRGELY